MKRYFAIVALCALTVLGLGSCVKPVEENLQAESAGGHTVAFDASLGGQTRTGLMFKFVPCWINTDLENVHLFETLGSTSQTDEGANVQMEIVEGTNNEVARFTAEFGEVTDIFVNTRAPETYSYSAIIAQRAEGKYLIPDVQTPDAQSLIDPDADFLIGKGVGVTTVGESKQVDLEFTRPVAVSRLAIMNMEGTKVRSVKITSTAKLTGSVAYSGIDFENGTVTFDPESGSNELTISYGDGVAMDETKTFYAYFISLQGAKPITSVVVTTDENIYTKTFDPAKTLTFGSDFKNIAVDMSKVTPVHVQTLSFSAETLAGMVGRKITAPALSGAQTSVSYTSSDEDVATVTNQGVLTLKAAGTTEITATAAAASGYAAADASYTLTVVAAPEFGTHYYRKVTSLAGVTTEKRYLIVYDNGSSSRVFTPVLNAAQDAFLTSDNKVNVTVVNDSLIFAGTTGIDLYQIGFDNMADMSGTSRKMAVLAQNAFGATPYYFMLFGLEGEQDTNQFAAHPTDNGYRATFDINGGVLSASRAVSGDTYYLTYSNSSFQVSTTAPSSSKIALYEYVAGLVPQTLTFSEPTASGTAGMPLTAPTLSGAMTTVTYASSNPAVATVNASTGALTLLTAGETTITATAAEADGYAAAEASYVLTVSAAEPLAAHYYQKVTQASDIVLDGMYVLVYENGASSKAFRPVRDGNVVLESNVENALAVSLYGGSYILASDALDACRIQLMNQDGTSLKFSLYLPALACYFHPYNETNNFAADDDTGYRSTISLSNGLATIVAKDNRAVRFSTSNQWFYAGNDNGALPAMYKYVEGENPAPVAQTLTFDPTSVSGAPSTSVAVTLSGAHTTVTWSTTDASVAEYNATTGKVDLKAVGTATITASAAAENGYAAASQTLEVTVAEIPQTLTFDPTSLSGSPFTYKPVTLEGAQTTVTWSTTDASVAEYDETSGKVHLKAAGTATITASAAAENGYAAASQTLQVTVTGSVPTAHYVKVTAASELTSETGAASGDYIFVYQTSATRAHVFKAICESAPTGDGSQGSGHVELTKSGSALEVDMTSDGIAATEDVVACKIQLMFNKNTAWYMRFDHTNNYWFRINPSNARLLAMTSKGYGPTFTFSSDAGNNLTVSRTESSASAYMVYNATNDCFEASGTSSKISIYKLSE